MRCVEFSRLFTGVCRKVADKIFIDESQYIIVLLTVHRNIFDELQKSADSLGACTGGIAELCQSGFKRRENLFININNIVDN